MLNLSNSRVDDAILSNFPLQALHNLPDMRAGRSLGRWLLLILFIMLASLFLPWQQNINGEGEVTALTPQDRPQTVQNAIAGRIEKWYVRDGQKVTKGDTLVVISEIKDEYFDPNLTQRLREQLDAKKDSRNATDTKIQNLNAQIAALGSGVRAKLQSARNKVKQNRFKVISDSTDLVAQRTNYRIAADRVARSERMYSEGGLISLTDLESRRLKLQEDYAKLISQEAKLNVARQELTNSVIDLRNIQADYEEKRAKAESDRSSAVSYRAEADGEIAKITNKISSVQVRQGLYVIRAPQDGFVVQSFKAGIGETIKEGESIVTLQPSNPEIAVELFVRPNDVSLIQRGRTVRIEFDGWPAVQFSGWPNVAVGTFGGEVQVIDAVASTNGKFRMLVRPKVEKGDTKWPEQLRVGSGVYGWVMLDDVPIWYEIWRQLNGFPPSLKNEPKADKGGPKK